jgi:glycosyltransferase involved in cell wall biosynthesis
VYLGIMGPQDGVDLAVRALDVLVREMGRTDCHVALLGFGDCLEELKALVHDMKLDDHVTFTGRADRKMISEYLSTADVGLCPDPLSPLNDLSTMNKTMEYMAYALPMVSFDLRETRVSAGDAAVYAEPNDVTMFAKDLVALLDDPDRRTTMALEARRRVAAHLDWQPQAERYLGVYRSLLGRPAAGAPEAGWPEVDRRLAVTRELRDEWGRRLVDLRSGGLPRFVQGRGAWHDSPPESKAG